MLNVIDSLPTAMLFLKPGVTKKNGEFFFHFLFC